jgi:Flp pilus assembly protein TadD
MPTPNELYDQAADLRDQGDKEGAVAKLEEAVAIDPGFAIAHGMLAKLHADLANAEQAVAHARKVVELEPDDSFSYTALSVIYQRCGLIPEAEHAKAMAYQKQMGFE